MNAEMRFLMPRPYCRGVRSAFTMIELLVVIGIIVLLAAILVPVAARVRLQAHVVSTTGQMQRIMTAIQDYYHDFSAYPGPLSEAEIQAGNSTIPISDSSPNGTSGAVSGITSSENLVLGLIGFLGPNTLPGTVLYISPPQHDVLSLNIYRPASYHYMDYLPSELSPGKTSQMDYTQSAVAGGTPPTDSLVPEFIDQIPSPMPILYMRASVGAPGIVSVAYGGTSATSYQYNPSELFMYTHNVRLSASSGGSLQSSLQTLDKMQSGVFQPAGSASPFVADVATPYQSWTDYLTNPNIANQALGKDAFILIDAGPDRMYGTHDDIIVAP